MIITAVILISVGALWCINRMIIMNAAIRYYRGHHEVASERNRLMWIAIQKDGYITKTDATRIWKETGVRTELDNGNAASVGSRDQAPGQPTGGM